MTGQEFSEATTAFGNFDLGAIHLRLEGLCNAETWSVFTTTDIQLEAKMASDMSVTMEGIFR